MAFGNFDTTDTVFLAALLLIAAGSTAAACDSSSDATPEGAGVESKVDAIRQRSNSFARDNQKTIEAHKPDTGLELPDPPPGGE